MREQLLKAWGGYRTRGWRFFRPYCELHFKAEASVQARVTIARFRLWDDVLWRSPASIATEAQSQSRFDLAAAISGWDAASLKKATALRREGLRLARVAERDEARCTVREVLSAGGKVLIAGDVAEVSAAEAALIAALRAFEHQLAKLDEYELRREWGHDAEDVDATTSANGWMRRVL